MKERQNKNIIFLNLIYQNAQMGLIGIDTVIKKVENNKIAKLIQEQRKEYEKFLEDAKSMVFGYYKSVNLLNMGRKKKKLVN